MDKKTRSGRSVLITGCSSGIGHELALFLSRNGFTVFATVRKKTDADQLRGLQEPSLIPICPFDLSRPADIPPAVEAVQAELARRGQRGLYALINNAGGGEVAPIELMNIDAFRTELQTRLAGAVAMVQNFLPLLRPGGGRIVWIVTPANIPTPYVASIHACDFAANCLARTLDIELKRWAIPNIQIRCGGIKTAKGLQTTADVEAILRHPHAELYAEALKRWSKDMAAFDEKRTSLEKVSLVVMAALNARRPRRRYSVGHMSRAAALLEFLPQSLADGILKMRF